MMMKSSKVGHLSLAMNYSFAATALAFVVAVIVLTAPSLRPSAINPLSVSEMSLPAD